MNKILSPKLTGIVMALRDEKRKQALDLRTQGERAYEQGQIQAQSLMEAAKKAKHSAIITANRLEKEADLLQEALNEELALEVKQEQESSAAWDIKSQAKLSAEFEADEVLLELIKKVN